MYTRLVRVVAVLVLGAAAGRRPARAGDVSGMSARDTLLLRADSAVYHVWATGPLDRVTIGFVFTNGTRAAVSAAYCRTPPPPDLEKWVNGRWTVAYRPVAWACKSEPPFRVAARAQYRGVLPVGAARPGARLVPAWQVDSVPGTYRLRWVLRAGPDPDNRARPLVAAASAPFELVRVP